MDLKTISIRGNIIAGILTLAPTGAALGIVVWFWNKLVRLTGIIPVEYQLHSLIDAKHPLTVKLVELVSALLTLLVILAIFWLVGLISRNYLGKRILDSVSRGFARVPVLSTVYSTLEQLLKTFASGQAKNFRRVVQVEYPRKGMYTLAFVTGERDGFVHIYVPTTPNPTSGFYLTVASAEVKDAGMSVEEALKEIISMGIVSKDG